MVTTVGPSRCSLLNILSAFPKNFCLCDWVRPFVEKNRRLQIIDELSILCSSNNLLSVSASPMLPWPIAMMKIHKIVSRCRSFSGETEGRHCCSLQASPLTSDSSCACTRWVRGLGHFSSCRWIVGPCIHAFVAALQGIKSSLYGNMNFTCLSRF